MTEQTEAPARPLYDRLRRIQLDNGWTNKQLADRAGISRGTIDNWKTQPRPPLPSTVKDVADRLGIPYPEALALAGVPVAHVSQVRMEVPAPPDEAAGDDDEDERMRQIEEKFREAAQAAAEGQALLEQLRRERRQGA